MPARRSVRKSTSAGLFTRQPITHTNFLAEGRRRRRGSAIRRLEALELCLCSPRGASIDCSSAGARDAAWERIQRETPQVATTGETQTRTSLSPSARPQAVRCAPIGTQREASLPRVITIASPRVKWHRFRLHTGRSVAPEPNARAAMSQYPIFMLPHLLVPPAEAAYFMPS